MHREPRFRRYFLPVVALVAVVLAACGGGGSGTGDGPTLFIGGIPDQNVTALERQFGLMAEYLSGATGLDVRYAPSVDYAAIVTAFRRGDVQLAWFGGLTGVQARAFVDDAEAIAQRPRDAAFHSVFIVQADLNVDELAGLAGLTFTFGSESSTSGHLMPRFFLLDAGIDADAGFNGPPNYSGSHDRTYKLVEAGAFQAGALNEAVWETAVAEGKVDTNKVRAFFTTQPYFDYNWTARGDLDDIYGEGTTARISAALLALREGLGPDVAELLELFQTDGFIVSENANYDAIREVAEELDILR